jgi:polar amino acid transport system substrate-binding protein
MMWMLVCLAGLCGAASATSRPFLNILTESTPPSSMMGEHAVIGFATDKVRMVMERSGVDYQIAMLPWKRAYTRASSEANACVYSTTRVPEREAKFKWVGPLHENDWTLFGLASRDYRIDTIEDARKLRIGAYNGDVRGEALQAEGFVVDLVQDPLANPRKLLLGRIDLWASSVRVGSAIVAEHGWTGQIVPLLTFKRTALYLACNPAIADGLIGQMNAALAAMNREGVSMAIERKYKVVLGTPPVNGRRD